MKEKHRDVKMDLLSRFGKLKKPLKTPKQVKHVKKTFLEGLQKTKNVTPDASMMRSINAFIRINLMEKRVPRFIGTNVRRQKLYQKAVRIMSQVSKIHGRNCANVKCKTKDAKNKKEKQKLRLQIVQLQKELREKTIEYRRMSRACEQAREKIPPNDNPVVRSLQAQLDIEKRRSRHFGQRARTAIQHNRATNDSVMRVLASATTLAQGHAAQNQKAIESSLRQREAAMEILDRTEDDLEDHFEARINMQQRVNNFKNVVDANFPWYLRSRLGNALNN